MQCRVPPREGGAARRAPPREGRADERLDLPRGRPRHPVQPLPDDDALPPLQRRALPRARRLRQRREPPYRLEPREPPGAGARRQPGPRDRARRRGALAGRGRAASAGCDSRVASRRDLDRGRRLGRPAHRHARPCRGRAGARRADRDRATRDRHPARAVTRGDRGRDRRRAGRDGACRQCLRDLGASGRGDGGRVHALGAGRPPAHRARRGGRARAAPRDAVLPGSRQPRLRQVGGRRDPLRRLRAEPGRALGRRGALGPRRHAGPAGPRALRAAHGRRRATLPLPARRGRGRAHRPPRRDDPGRQPAGRADSGRAGVLDGRRPLAERLRRRRRPRQDASPSGSARGRPSST